MREKNYERLLRRYRVVSAVLLVSLILGGLHLWHGNPLGRSLSDTNIQMSQSEADYSDFADDYASLQTEHEALEHSYERLRLNHQRLQQEYDEVVASYKNLSTTHQQLTLEHRVLAKALTVTDEDYETMLAQSEQLGQTTLTPPYIAIDGRWMQLVFVKLDGSIIQWHVPFQSLEADIQRGHERRQGWLSRLNPILTLQDAEGNTYTPLDFRPYIDPRPFEGVMAQLYNQSPDDDTFVREVWNIIRQLATYSEEIEETPRYPLETLLAGGGDCEDTGILFASMIRAAPVDWPLSLVYMDAQNPEKPVTVNHLIVFVDTGSRQYLIETTSDFAMEPFAQVEGWYVEVE